MYTYILFTARICMVGLLLLTVSCVCLMGPSIALSIISLPTVEVFGRPMVAVTAARLLALPARALEEEPVVARAGALRASVEALVAQRADEGVNYGMQR